MTFDGGTLTKAPQHVPFDPVSAAKGAYKHFMLKEIMEQPECIVDTFRGRASFAPAGVELEDLHVSDDVLRGVTRVVLVGMGTSMHAALVGRTYFERIAGIPAEVDNASEFRYRDPLIGPDTLVVSVAQSGETVDTLEAMADAKRPRRPQITICNTPGAQTTRVADGAVLTRCGPEVAVASTKTLTASITALYLLACHIGRVRGVLEDARLRGADRTIWRTLPGADGARAADGAADRGDRARAVGEPELPLPRPRHAVPDGDGGRAQAQGGQLHPRRGLPRRRR